jgi:hypothetical protein
MLASERRFDDDDAAIGDRDRAFLCADEIDCRHKDWRHTLRPPVLHMTLRGSFDDSEAGDHDPIVTASLDLLNYSPTHRDRQTNSSIK